MPENLENVDNSNESLTIDTTAQHEVEAAAEPVVEKPKYVPLSEHLEERHRRQDLEQRQRMLENTLIQLQQQLQQQQSTANQPQLDPELQKLLDPYVAPLRQELEKARQLLWQNQQEIENNRKLDYVKQNAPEIDSVKDELAEVVREMDEDERNHFLASPKLIVKMVKALASEKKTVTSNKTRQVARAMGKTETASTSQAESVEQGGNVDWEKMSSDDFANHPLTRALQL